MPTGVGLIFNELTVDDAEHARRVAVVVERRAALRPPPKKPHIVGHRALHARERSLKWRRRRDRIESCGLSVFEGNRREEPWGQGRRDEPFRTSFVTHTCSASLHAGETGE
jgi:hypothetical protein